MKQLLPILIIFCSCTSTNKHKTVTSSKIDSVSHVKTDSTVIKAFLRANVNYDKTVKVEEADIQYDKKTVIEFEPTNGTADDYLNVSNSTPLGARKTAVSSKKPVQRIKSITIFESGKDKSKTITKTDTKDSTVHSDQQQAAVTKQTDTHLQKKEDSKVKDVKRTSFNWWWLLLLLLIPAYYYGRKYWPYIKAAFLIF